MVRKAAVPFVLAILFQSTFNWGWSGRRGDVVGYATFLVAGALAFAGVCQLEKPSIFSSSSAMCASMTCMPGLLPMSSTTLVEHLGGGHDRGPDGYDG